MHAPDAPPSSLESDPDRLLARYRETGDPRLFGAFFDATSAELHRIAVSLLPDPVGADDAVQETYLTALQVLERFDGQRRVMPWLAGILRNVVLHARRSHRRHRTSALLPGDEKPGQAEVDSPEGEGGAQARAAMDALEEPYRSAALLRWRYGLEPAQIAHVRGEPPGTTRSILARAVERMRRSWKKVPAAFLGSAGGHGGLEAVRSLVVDRAAEVGPGLAAAAGVAAASAARAGAVALGGGLLVKQMLAVMAVLAMLCAGGWALWGRSPPMEERRSVAAPAPALVEGLAARPAPSTRLGPTGAVVGGSIGADEAVALVVRTVRGRVTTRDGQPVARAHVISYGPGTRPYLSSEMHEDDPVAPADLPLGAHALTDEEGRFAVTPTDGASSWLLVRAPRFRSVVLSDVVPGRPRDVVLRPSASLHGRVLNQAGEAIPGAWIVVGGLVDRFQATSRTRADAEGRYRLDDLPGLDAAVSAIATLVAGADGYAPLFLDPRDEWPDAPAPGEDRLLNLVLTRGAQVEGRVVDAETGEPVTQASVHLWVAANAKGLYVSGNQALTSPLHPFDLGFLRTDAEGRFAYDHVPCDGFQQIRTTNVSRTTGRALLGHVVSWAPGYASGAAEVPIGHEGETLPCEIRLRRAATVSGRVVDGSGRPVGGVAVFVSDPLDPERGDPVSVPTWGWDFPHASARTAADGAYAMRGVPVSATGPQRIRIQAFGPVGGRDVSPVGHATTELEVSAGGVFLAPDLVLVPNLIGAVGRLRILDASGAPIPGAMASWLDMGDFHAADATGVVTLRVRFAVPDGDEAESRPVEVRAAGWAPVATRAAIRRDGRGSGDVPEVRLRPAHRLTGLVRAPEGLAPQGTLVRVGDGRLPIARVFPELFPRAVPSEEDEGEPRIRVYASVEVDAEGRFDVAELPEGPYVVLAEAPLPSAEADPEAPHRFVVQSDVATDGKLEPLVLPARDPTRAHVVELRVVDAETGRPILRPRGHISRSTSPARAGRATEPGVLQFSGVRPGRFTVTVEADAYEPWTDPAFDVGERPLEPVRVPLRPLPATQPR